MKKVASILNPCPSLGGDDGLAARTLFSHQDHADRHSPFLRLNYAAPTHYSPHSRRHKVHGSAQRGFETVTLVYQGELEYRDSTGQSGILEPGDVHWLSAASGLLYQVRHSEQFARQGGPWEMVQLWVNLPARAKSRAPSQQHLSKTQVPVRALPDESGTIRVIAGQYQEQPGAAHHHSPLLLWDIQIKAGHQACFQVPEGWNSSLLVLSGAVRVNQQTLARPSQVVLLEQEGQHIALDAQNDTRLLLLGGEPINEPVQAYGPFVMNTQQEITQALADFDQGRFGCLG